MMKMKDNDCVEDAVKMFSSVYTGEGELFVDGVKIEKIKS